MLFSSEHSPYFLSVEEGSQRALPSSTHAWTFPWSLLLEFSPPPPLPHSTASSFLVWPSDSPVPSWASDWLGFVALSRPSFSTSYLVFFRGLFTDSVLGQVMWYWTARAHEANNLPANTMKPLSHSMTSNGLLACLDDCGKDEQRKGWWHWTEQRSLLIGDTKTKEAHVWINKYSETERSTVIEREKGNKME